MLKRRINRFLIIDAYNVINAIEELKRGIDHDFEKVREDFIYKMIELGHYSKEKVIVVFDAYTIKSKKEKIETRDGVDIVFTKYTQTADSYIEKLVSELSENINNEIRVVTKDLAEQQFVMGKGAMRVLPQELYYEYQFMSLSIKKKYNRKEIAVSDSIENRLDIKSQEALNKLSNKE
ncbi:MAG: NYN domain-containing protein [Clostridiales bacterium]|nr:NYN domain-containing protein [Clostridiales bacterium]